MDICSSPRLFAACHVLRRLLMPRHSPCALSSLTCSSQAPYRSPPSASLSACDDVSLIPLLLAFHQKTQFFDDGDGRHETLWPLLRVVRESWFSLRIMQALQRLTKLLLPCTLPGAVPQSILLPSRSRKGTSLVALLAFCHIVQFSRCRSLTSFEVRSKHSASRMLRFDLKFGGDSRVRTGDLLLARQALSS